MGRRTVLEWLKGGLAAVDPRVLTARHLEGTKSGATVFAIGKAAPAMCWGAADTVGPIRGICVTDTVAEVPGGVHLVLGDHPVPGPASFEAGRMVMEMATGVAGRCIALISGGGSALCEHLLPGVDAGFFADATRALIGSGASIEEVNLIRGHLSALKAGGLARALGVPVETLVLSDVAGHGPEWVASGPTLSTGRDPDRALELLVEHGMTIEPEIETALRSMDPRPVDGKVTVIGDGRTAAKAVAAVALDQGVVAALHPQWLTGPIDDCLGEFFEGAGPGVTIGAGEPSVRVGGPGSGGRNTHAALIAAQRISGTDALFAALATDGVDGSSGSAGAIVDGETVSRGGDPAQALSRYDSATYLSATGDLVVTGPTGTNVADLWVVWRR
jgi:glycerate 2-kinase